MLTHVLHANWSEGHLLLWAEHAARASLPGAGGVALPGGADAAPPHPFAAAAADVEALVRDAVETDEPLPAGVLAVALPGHGGRPVASPSVAHAAGHTTAEDEGGVAVLERFAVPCVRVGPARACQVLEALDARYAGEDEFDDDDAAAKVGAGASLRFFAAAARFTRWLLAQQRFVPTLVQDMRGQVRGLWQPWLADDMTAQRAGLLLQGMPPAARAAVDHLEHDAWAVLEDFLVRVTDARCRAVLRRETMEETIDGRPASDPHVAWLTGLLRENEGVPTQGEHRSDLLKRVRHWIGALDQRGSDSAWRLCLRLSEPVDLTGLEDLQAPGPAMTWPLTLHLQSVESPEVMLDAADIWVLPTDGAMVAGRRVDHPQELLLGELGRAARLYKPLEDALSQAEPSMLRLSTPQAYEFLREYRGVLGEQGIGVMVPEWWDSPGSRLGVRLRIDPNAPDEAGASGPSSVGSRIGLGTLVNYRWQISLGQTTLSIHEFERLASMRTPLVMIGGRWVEVRPEDVKAAMEFIRENPGGEMELGKAIRLAYAADLRQTGLPVVGMDVGGWLSSIFAEGSQDLVAQTMAISEPPASFVGSLRPYQLKGLSWLAFMDKFGLGACLADDMGLGKTIQFLAMLLRERELAALEPPPPGQTAPAKVRPTLLIVPMSVIGNWVRESRRFAPSLEVLVHHGLERKIGKDLMDAALGCDIMVTTYALAHRDREALELVPWERIALDEAQNIKNPGAKQTQAIRAIDAPKRVALTGTPIENRLSELWSIMDFLNPGLLGPLGDFRSRFAVPIERYHDQAKAKRLRALVQPFVLRRLKTDPTVIADLPEKVETKEFCYLTPEQASLYESTVKQMLSAAEASDGMKRRGVILAGLIRLKQICNHPVQFLKEHDAAPAGQVPVAARSGKCVRLVQMLEEVVDSGGQALVFTQFRQMGSILAALLRHTLDREVLFLHGGTPAKDRESMIAAFQRGDGRNPVFILSLKAGGVGLNLTGANHVFHFDRWWNPAVENQATDRAYRIGQTRTVQVHKFVVAGTLEERIDQMIEQKTALAENVIGSGEAWLTELSLNQLRDVLQLRPEAVAEGEDER